MKNPVDLAMADPWSALGHVLDGPLHPGGRDATDRLLDRAGVDAGTKLLDVGCGAGEALALARERDARAIGLDRDPTSTDTADDPVSEVTDRDAGTGATVPDCETIRGDMVCGDMESLPIGDDAVDVVLAECVLCLASDLDRALAETNRVVASDGRLAFSDVVVDGSLPDLPDGVAEALCLTGSRGREHLVASVERAGYAIESRQDHRTDLLAMRDELAKRVDYEGLLRTMGDRGEALLDGIEALEQAVEDGRVSYVSVVARAAV